MAGSNFGGTVKLTGESEYSRALKNITSELKTMGSQLKLATVEFENNGYKVGDLRAKNDAGQWTGSFAPYGRTASRKSMC